MKPSGLIFLIMFGCMLMHVPDSYGAKKYGREFLGEVMQKELLCIQEEPVILSEETIMDFQEELCNMLLLLDYVWQLFNSAQLPRLDKSLFEVFKFDLTTSNTPFLDVEERLRWIVLKLVEQLKLSEKILYKKPGPLDTFNDFRLWMKEYTPIIIYLFECCLKRIKGPLFHNRPEVFDEKSKDYIDIERILVLLDARINFPIKGSVFMQNDNELLLNFPVFRKNGEALFASVFFSKVQDRGRGVVEQIKERHKKVCDPEPEPEPEESGKSLHLVASCQELYGEDSGDDLDGDVGINCGLSICGLPFNPFID